MTGAEAPTDPPAGAGTGARNEALAAVILTVVPALNELLKELTGLVGRLGRPRKQHTHELPTQPVVRYEPRWGAVSMAAFIGVLLGLNLGWYWLPSGWFHSSTTIKTAMNGAVVTTQVTNHTWGPQVAIVLGVTFLAGVTAYFLTRRRIVALELTESRTYPAGDRP